jgi:hypothetical protein
MVAPGAHALDLLRKEDPMNPQAQWMAEIAVNAPLKTVWEVVDDVTLIPRYHPEVDTVDVIAGQARQAVGTVYQCNILEGRHAGSCVEEVLAYEPESMVATGMVSDTWGIDKMLADFRVVSSVSRRTETSTILRFEAFYKPVGLKNRLLNAWFLRRALRKRSLAVMNGIKRVAEGNVDGATDGAPQAEPRRFRHTSIDHLL